MNTVGGPIRRILVISLAGAGDTLLLTPLLRELHIAYPAAHLDVLTMQGAPAREVLAGNGNIHAHLHHDFQRESGWSSLRFCLGLRRRRYDLSITPMPHNRFAYNFITRALGARERLGFDYAIRCGSCSQWLLTRTIAEAPLSHVVDNNLRLFPEALGLPLSGQPIRLELHVGPEPAQRADAWLGESGLAGRKLLGFHPGSGTTKNLILKRWAPEKWAALATRLVAAPQTSIILFGTPDELALRQHIIAASGLPSRQIINAPAGTVQETAALMQRLAVFVCGDTLLTHVAAAVGTPEVVVVGPTPHTATYPYGVPHRIVRLGLACSPCYGYSRYGIRCTHPRPLACLADLGVDRVAEAVESLMGELVRWRSAAPPPLNR